jgi:hypothetical protein
MVGWRLDTVVHGLQGCADGGNERVRGRIGAWACSLGGGCEKRVELGTDGVGFALDAECTLLECDKGVES